MGKGEVGKRLRVLREARALSQSDCARQMGVNRSLVCRVELGQAAPYPKFRRRAAEILNLPEEIVFARAVPDGRGT